MNGLFIRLFSLLNFIKIPHFECRKLVRKYEPIENKSYIQNIYNKFNIYILYLRYYILHYLINTTLADINKSSINLQTKLDTHMDLVEFSDKTNNILVFRNILLSDAIKNKTNIYKTHKTYNYIDNINILTIKVNNVNIKPYLNQYAKYNNNIVNIILSLLSNISEQDIHKHNIQVEYLSDDFITIHTKTVIYSDYSLNTSFSDFINKL